MRNIKCRKCGHYSIQHIEHGGCQAVEKGNICNCFEYPSAIDANEKKRVFWIRVLAIALILSPVVLTLVLMVLK
jgi:hypothetical protein